jgi:hypothetical protein
MGRLLPVLLLAACAAPAGPPQAGPELRREAAMMEEFHPSLATRGRAVVAGQETPRRLPGIIDSDDPSPLLLDHRFWDPDSYD